MISKQHTQDSCLIKCMALAWQSPLLVKLSPHHSSQLLLLEKHPDNYKQIVPLSSFNVQHIIRKHGFTESYYCCGNIEVIIKKSQWEKILYLARRQDTKNIYSSLSYSWIPNRPSGQLFGSTGVATIEGAATNETPICLIICPIDLALLMTQLLS